MQKYLPYLQKTYFMIHIQSFTFNPFQENTYIVYTESGECMIIDPGCYDHAEEKILSDFISKNDLNPTLLVNTHCHIDHVFGNKFISEKYGLTPIIHPLEADMLEAVSRVAEMYGLDYTASPAPEILKDDEIKLGNESFKVLFVPGHSPGHIALYHANSTSLIVGDVLFRQSIGRTDLPGGDMDILLNSIRTELFILPDQTIVYPGHMDQTTIGYEKKHNPFLN